MKKIEQMASDYVACVYPEMNLAGIYIAGFKAAREMAMKEIDRLDADPVGNAWDAINKLGEEEV
ncbi:MAG: hypothetical protein V4568_14630 [Pseudomonadota bacterium]